MAELDLPSGKTPATKVAGHEIRQPRTLDAEHDHEVTRHNDLAISGGEEEPETVKSPTPTKTADVKEKKE